LNEEFRMTTTTLHRQTQRDRLQQHALALGGSAWTAALAWLARRRAAHAAESRLRRLASDTKKARDLAHRYASIDPGFAADLHAAVLRHEGKEPVWSTPVPSRIGGSR
jgi:uncharacterized membrane protein YcjF (UPF0283 family)